MSLPAGSTAEYTAPEVTPMTNTNAPILIGLLRPVPATPSNGLGMPQGSLLSVRKAGGDKGGDYSIIAI